MPRMIAQGVLFLSFALTAAWAGEPPAAASSNRDFSGIWTLDEERGVMAFGFDAVKKAVIPIPPMTAEYEKTYKERMAAIAAGRPPRDSGAACLPNGMPRMMRDRPAYPIEIVMTPTTMYTLHEYQRQIRRIYLDGRSHPEAEDLEPSFSGHSIGRWEGDTLIVDTVAIKAGWYDQGGLPHSDEIVVTERIRKVGPEALENQITIVDPKVFKETWTVTKRYKLRKDVEMHEFVCEENNRHPVGNGGVTTVVP